LLLSHLQISNGPFALFNTLSIMSSGRIQLDTNANPTICARDNHNSHLLTTSQSNLRSPSVCLCPIALVVLLCLSNLLSVILVIKSVSQCFHSASPIFTVITFAFACIPVDCCPQALTLTLTKYFP